MAAAAPFLLIAGTAVAAAGAIQQASSAAAAARFNAAQAQQNAELSRRQAAQDENSFRAMNQKQMGVARTGYGASGVQLEGSPLELLSSNAAAMELDALRIRQGGQVKAAGYMSDAALNNSRARSASIGGYISASSELLGGANKGIEKGYF